MMMINIEKTKKKVFEQSKKQKKHKKKTYGLHLKLTSWDEWAESNKRKDVSKLKDAQLRWSDGIFQPWANLWDNIVFSLEMFYLLFFFLLFCFNFFDCFYCFAVSTIFFRDFLFFFSVSSFSAGLNNWISDT